MTRVGGRTYLHADGRGHQRRELSLHPGPQARAGASTSRQHHVAEEALPEGGAAGADAAEGGHVDAQAVSLWPWGRRTGHGDRAVAGCMPGPPSLGSQCGGRT